MTTVSHRADAERLGRASGGAAGGGGPVEGGRPSAEEDYVEELTPEEMDRLVDEAVG